jgi:hypothetical protein
MVFNKLLRLTGVWVTDVNFAGTVVVDVKLKRRHLVCPDCGWTTRTVHNAQQRPRRGGRWTWACGG